MKKILSILSLAVILSACQQSKDKTEQTQEVNSTSPESTARASYTCSMHPEVVSDKPGKCPKCEMDLIVKESSDVDDMHADTTNHIH